MKTRWPGVFGILAFAGWAMDVQGASPLKIELSSDKATYREGEEIVLKVAVTNTSDAATPILVRGFDWADLERMDESYKKLEKLAESGKVGPKASLDSAFARGNLADKIRADGGPQPLGRLDLVGEPPEKFRRGFDVCVLGCGTGLKSGQMPAGLRTTQEYKIAREMEHAAPGIYRFVWSAAPPREGASSDANLKAYSNILEIEITK